MTCTALTGRTAVSVPPLQVIVPSTPQGDPCAQLAEPLAPNTARAYRSDLAYFWAWARAALGRPPVYPVSVEETLLFIEHHTQGLPTGVDAGLVQEGAKGRVGRHAISTIARRVLVLGLAHRERGLPSPYDDVKVRRTLKLARRRAAGQAVGRKPITRTVLEQLLATCDGSLRGHRDRALLLLGFVSGGRRRSEIAALRFDDLTRVHEGYLIRIRRSKNDQYGRGLEVPVLGEAARALDRWLEVSGIRQGGLFRGVRPDGRLTATLSDKAIANIIKRRTRLAGLNPVEYGAHSLRSGFVTEAGRQRIFLGDVMALSGHRSVGVALRYYRAGDVLRNPAARLLG